MTDSLDGIRAACEKVSEQARWVRINHERLDAYAASLPVEQLTANWAETDPYYLAGEAGSISFILCLNAINFGSGYFPHLRKRAGMSGFYTVASGLKEHFERHGPPTAADLAAITPDQCAAMFGQQGANEDALELMALFARALNDLGGLLAGRYGGDAQALLAAAQGSAGRLVELLLAMPLYGDIERYRGLDVPFLKRAQITAQDFAMALPSSMTRDLDRLTIFADNLVPHVLRLDGVLWFEGALVERIEREELLDYGSEEEVEIRACALHACELIVARLKRGAPQATAARLDNLLWHRGQGAGYKARPRHRCRTTAY